jgi:hypothetical protein
MNARWEAIGTLWKGTIVERSRGQGEEYRNCREPAYSTRFHGKYRFEALPRYESAMIVRGS